MYAETATQQKVHEPLAVKLAQARKLAYGINENVKRISSAIHGPIPETVSKDSRGLEGSLSGDLDNLIDLLRGIDYATTNIGSDLSGASSQPNTGYAKLG
jgi:hypothetical protein